jgi:hypothetical protein
VLKTSCHEDIWEVQVVFQTFLIPALHAGELKASVPGRKTPSSFWGAYKSLVRPTSQCILFDGENISFDPSLVIYRNSTNISLIVIINRIYEHQNLLSL